MSAAVWGCSKLAGFEHDQEFGKEGQHRSSGQPEADDKMHSRPTASTGRVFNTSKLFVVRAETLREFGLPAAKLFTSV